MLDVMCANKEKPSFYLNYILCFSLICVLNNVIYAQLKDFDAGEYETFFNTGFGKLDKSKSATDKLQNSIHKSKVEVLGETLKQRVSRLRKAPNRQVELVFLVDSSASVGAENFFNELKFVKKLLADFTVAFNYTRVAVVTFSSRSRVVRQIDHLSKASTSNHKCRLLEEELPKINYTGGGTYTLGAVLEAQSILKNARPNAVKVVFLITDGYSNGGDPRVAAKLLQDSNVEMFTFGIKNGNVRELFDMASPPPQEHSYILDSFDEFEALARRALHEDLHIGSYEEEDDQMCTRLCEEKTNCCDVQAKCTCGTHTGHYACLCQKGFYGTGLAGDCKPCPSGTYLDSSGPTDIGACKLCPDVNHNSEAGSSSVDQCKCRKGYMSNNTKCVEMECPKLQPPENGYFVKNDCDNVFNSACGIRCNPGYTLFGSSIRLCNEDGKWTGEEPSCVIKNCTKLKDPRHGKMECSNDVFSFETHCNFTCDPGFVAIGSKTRTCLAIASWDGLPSHCRPVTCPALKSVPNGKITPSKCTTHKSQYGDSCNYTCEVGFALQGPAELQCIKQGGWSSSEKKIRCIDVSPPNITCPSNIEVGADENENSAAITWDPPIVSDNSGEKVIMTSVPAISLPMKFPIGLSVVNYVAQDRLKNRAECNFTVMVQDLLPPIVDSCISPPVFLTREKSVDVVWEEPIFSDNSGTLVQVNRSHNPGPFPFGETQVSYTAWDEAGNNSTCIITITIQEHACTTPMDPLNGHSNCSELEDGVVCSLTCGEGYAFAFRPPTSYFCAYDGVWTPNNDSFPDCSLTALPRDILQNGIITLQSDDVPCDDTFFMHQVENKFLRKLSNKVMLYCVDEIECDATYVSAACEEFISEAEEESNYILRRRRRQISANSTETFSHAVNRTEIVTIHKSSKETERFTALISRKHADQDELQKVNLRFQLTGKLKLAEENVTQNATSLRAQMLNILDNLHRDAQKGELDLLMGRYNLTYGGMRLLSEKPLFICEAGSILLDEQCVKCPVGTFYNVVSEQCQPCARGSYQFAEGQLSCLVCPDNTSTSHGQSKSSGECKAQCLPGSFSSNGLESCETCPKSFYQPGYSTTSCLPCPTNTTTWKRGARKEQECREMCPKGHVSETGLVPCYTCPLGYYQPESGKRVCFRCHNGAPTTGMGSTSISYCLETPVSDEEALKTPIEELLVNDCFSVPCLNGGSCHVLAFGYICDCIPGFTGMHCETEVNECDSNSCQNGGKCEDGRNKYICHCIPGYGGTSCEEDLDECALHPCLNGATCIDQINNFQCQCISGFAGRICQNDINECVLQPCQNNGTCIDQIASYQCVCPKGFIGDDCEVDVDECESMPCTNGATCLDLKGEFRCICLQGFTGVLCDVNIDECMPDPCSNGATCMDEINTFKCICPPAFAGKLCETELSSAFIMHFPISGIMDFAQAEGFHKDLAQMSACLWLKTNDRLNYGTPISYANTSVDNIFTLTDYNGFVLYVNGEKVITDVTANDDRWHFVCVTWTNAGGLWRIYKNGILKDEGGNLANGTLIPGDGTLVIGQEQDTLLGGFSAAESFIGYVAYVDFWDRVLAPQEILKFSTACDKYRGSVRAWADFLAGIRGRIKLEESLFCKGCPKLGPYENGRIALSGSGVASSLVYECNDGYTVKGLQTRRCMIHGDWEGKEPKCQLSSCGFPGYLENGRITGNGYMFQDTIRYICNAGYRLVGNESRICAANGHWERQPPVCTEILCDPPFPPDNGRLVTTLARFRSSVQVDYICNPGYRMNGASSLTCTLDGVWDEEPPTCQPMFCSDPPVLQNGDIEGGVREVQVGENITLQCNEGYELIGGGVLLCLKERQWEGSMPLCSPRDCGRPPNIPNSKMEVEDTFYESVASYTCLHGYAVKGITKPILVCGSMGNWEGSAIRCDPIQCPAPQNLRYGDIKVGSIVFKSKVIYSCMEGYVLTGDSVRTCLANGTWSGQSPQCSRVRCPAPENITNGHFEGKGPWVAGLTVMFACNIGYRLEGSSQSTCLESGLWSQQTPRCRMVECPYPESVPNGFFIGDTEEAFTFKSILLYACDEGHRLDGSVSRQCTENGSWSGVAPKCEKVSCGSVDNIKHGKVILDSFLYLSQVQYICNKGFQLKGPQVRTCLSNGTWSEREPTCAGAHCPTLDPLLYGEIELSGSAVQGAVAVYVCQIGYILEGVTQRRCEEEQGRLRWSATAPRCLPVNCTALDQIPHGFVQASSLQYESVAEYSCAAGYDLVGPDTRTCQVDGSWSDLAPGCRLKECPELRKIHHGRALGGSYAVGAIIQFECESGFKLNGLQNVTCTEDKTWSAVLPRCIPVSCKWPLRVPEHGRTNSTGHMFNSEIRYSCNEGYTLVGAPQRVCLADGAWGGAEPLCEPVRCPPLENPQNGEIRVKDNSLGSMARYDCQENYVLVGAPWRRCMANKTWSPEEPHCKPLVCPELESVADGSFMVSDQALTLGTTANYTCDTGYQLIGNDTLRCTTPGYWDGDFPECRPVLCQLTEASGIEHGSMIRTHTTEPKPGSILEFSCDKGYKLVGEYTVTCLPNGHWNAPFPICTITSCPPPPSLPHGKMSAEEFTVGAKVIYSCDRGYRLIGVANHTCTTKSTWSDAIPHCDIVNCPRLKPLANGIAIWADVEHSHTYGANVTFECLPGFVLQGDVNLMCKEDGSWNTEAPSCEVISCAKPPDVVNGLLEVIMPVMQIGWNGTFKGTSYPWETQAQYTCKVGHVLNGDSAPRQCNEDGQWTGNAPECLPILCGHPTKPTNGHVQVNSTRFGSVAKYTCDIGHILARPAQRTCLSSGSWSGLKPQCAIVHCPHVGLLSHGKYRLSGNGTFGTVVMAECNAEFRLVGSGIRICQTDGSWSGMEPHCASIECPIPEAIAYGRLELDSTVVGGAVQYSCERGYELVGDSILTCMLDGSWSNGAPKCSTIECPELTGVPNGQTTGAGRILASVIEYVCNEGYELRGGDKKRTCFENRTWSGEEPSCVLIVCARPDDLANGHVLVLGHGLGSVARYSCNEGFTLRGNVTRVCQSNKKWSGQAPNCKIRTCSLLSAIQNGRPMPGTSVEKSEYGAVVRFVCSPMFSLSGKPQIRCLANGTWDGEVPICTRSHCDKLPAVSDALIKGNSTLIDHKITYSCRDGFVLVGEAWRKCLPSGHWSGDAPKCVPVSCGPPPEVENALIQLVIPHGQELYSYSSTAAYACTDGYELTGSPALVCEGNAKWLGRTPTCKKFTCGPPPVVAHTTVQVENYEPLSRAIYFCDEGFNLDSNGSTVAHCLPSGVWDSNMEGLKCIPVVCGPPPALHNGHVTAEDYNFGSAAIYSCNLGYRKMQTSGKGMICNSKGHWQGSKPHCRPIMCSRPELPANSLLENGGEFRFGMSVTYTCRTGYRLVGKDIRTCKLNGHWSGSIPQCHRIQCEEPESPKNGFVMVDDRKLGDVARFRCEEGYQLDGAEQVSCNENGNWTMAIPTCRPLTCEKPPFPANATGIDMKENYVFEDVIRGTCTPGFYSTAEILLECLADGNWTLPVGQCQRVSCGPPQINAGVVVLGSSYLFQDKLAYVCPPGLQHKGKGILTCQSDGTWDSIPSCEVHCAKSCLNNGICIKPGKCKCPMGFVGDRCQHAICILPCLHGGTCVAPYRCICNPNYLGSRCHIPFCSIPCLHGGTCIGYNLCSCLPGYSGPQCKTSLNKGSADA